MDKLQLINLLSQPSTQVNEYFSSLESNKRNTTLRNIREYYQGNHWLYDEDGKSNTTMSGKKIWGGRTRQGNSTDVYQRSGKSKDVSFTRGQLQTINYIKRFTQVYQDYILKGGDVKIYVESENEDLQQKENLILDEIWEDAGVFVKEQVTKLVLNTVGVSKLIYTNNRYYVRAVDAINVYPIYDDTVIVGTIESYMIDAAEAKAYGITTKEKMVSYADVYYPDDSGQYYNIKFVNGEIISDDGKPTKLIPELNFNPYNIVSNLDHPFTVFDNDSLEDSEVFEWIDKNDTLNATRTIEFLSNLFLASPKVGVDHEKLEKMNLTLEDPALQDALSRFQWSPYTIDTLPIEVHQGNGIPDSFYKGLAMIRQGLFEDASIPDFLITGEIAGGLATETLELGLSMLESKINQKREQIKKLIRSVSEKVLQVNGIEGAVIEIEMPPVKELAIKDMIREIRENTIAGILPTRYSQGEVLKLLNKGDDIAIVKEMEQDDLGEVTKLIQQKRGLVQSEIQAEVQVKREEQQKEELKQTEDRIKELSQ